MDLTNIDKSNLKYVTRGIVDEQLCAAEISISLKKKNGFKLNYACASFCAITSVVLYLINYSRIYVFLFALFAVILIWEVHLIYKRTIKKCVELTRGQYLEITGSADFEIITGFTENQVYREYIMSGEKRAVDLSNVDEAYLISDYIFLLTKMSLLFIVFKAELSDNECCELISFLQEKGIKVKEYKIKRI